MPLADGEMHDMVIVTTDDDDLQEVSVVHGAQRITIYARWKDDAIWLKSVKTGMMGADAWAIVGEITIDDPFYRTLNEYVRLSRLIAGYGEYGDGINVDTGRITGDSHAAVSRSERSAPVGTA